MMAAPIRLIGIDGDLGRIVEGDGDDFNKVYGASLGDNGAVVREVVSQTLALLARAPRAAEWGGYLVIDEARGVVIGTCGFAHGPEADGTVEIAYFTFPEFERRGYATAMAAVLVERALRSGIVREVVAHTLPVRNASTRVLEKVGLQRAGEAHDPEVGKVWRWVCRTEV
jgi:[ribosomal protein S5]-alanine N-acetyltransferase